MHSEVKVEGRLHMESEVLSMLECSSRTLFSSNRYLIFVVFAMMRVAIILSLDLDVRFINEAKPKKIVTVKKAVDIN